METMGQRLHFSTNLKIDFISNKNIYFTLRIFFCLEDSVIKVCCLFYIIVDLALKTSIVSNVLDA